MKKLIKSTTETYTTDFAAVTIWKNTVLTDEDVFGFEIRYDFRNIQTNELSTGDLNPDELRHVLNREFEDVSNSKPHNIAEYVYDILI